MSDSYRRRFKLFRYRKPERWATIKRAALVGGAALALGLKSRGAFKGALKAHHAGQLAVEDIKRLKRITPSYAGYWQTALKRKLGETMTHLGKLRGHQRALRLRGARFRRASMLTGTLGAGYAGMPYARKRGQQNNLRWQRQQWGK